jgi:hypothetical protein
MEEKGGVNCVSKTAELQMSDYMWEKLSKAVHSSPQRSRKAQLRNDFQGKSEDKN